jgi:hypothetical protein
MPEEILKYDRMVENALRGVVRDALALTAKNGPMGDHHFYITFRTGYPGTRVPDYIRAQHPDEMTIVLQHQFWDLTVTDEGFGVALSFSGVSENLWIPFAAVTGFADPSAKFGLQFQGEEMPPPDDGEDVPEEGETPAVDEAPPAAGEGGKVVALDAFRKK